MGDGWTWASLSAYSENLTSSQIQDILPGSETVRSNPHLAAVQFRGARAEASLAELVEEITAYFELHGEEIGSRFDRADFQLRIGWSPRSPQESIVLPSALFSALAKLSVDVMLDVYDTKE